MENIILIGGGGHARSVIDVIEQEKKYNIIGIIDRKELIGNKVLGYEIIGFDEDLEQQFENCKNAIVTVGQIKSNSARINIFNRLKDIGYNLPIIISPLAYVSKHSIIHEGTIVMHNALVNSNVIIGRNCIINTKALIEHDAIIENHCHISTAAVINGGVLVKENTFIGSNSTCGEYITVTDFVKAGTLQK